MTDPLPHDLETLERHLAAERAARALVEEQFAEQNNDLSHANASLKSICD